jgi:hypothetical protein
VTHLADWLPQSGLSTCDSYTVPIVKVWWLNTLQFNWADRDVGSKLRSAFEPAANARI